MSAIAERVSAGAAFLDEHDPEWWRADVEDAIDLDHLDLGDGSRCVLGQRCPLAVLAEHFGLSSPQEDDLTSGDWTEAYDAYSDHLSGLTGEDRSYWARDHGFTVIRYEPSGPGDEWADNWQPLTAEWKRVITERRAAS